MRGTARRAPTMGRVYVMVFLALMVFISGPDMVFADSDYVGTVISGEGLEDIENGLFLLPGDKIQSKTILRTGPHGSAAILCADESLLRMNADTELVFEKVAQTAAWVTSHSSAMDRVSTYRLRSGEIWLRNKNTHMVITLETETMTARLTGTELNLQVLPEDRVVMTVQEGLVIASNAMGSLSVAQGESLFAITGNPLEKQMLVSAKDVIQWTLTLPDLPGFFDLPLISSDRVYLKTEAEQTAPKLAADPSNITASTRTPPGTSPKHLPDWGSL